MYVESMQWENSILTAAWWPGRCRWCPTCWSTCFCLSRRIPCQSEALSVWYLPGDFSKSASENDFLQSLQERVPCYFANTFYAFREGSIKFTPVTKRTSYQLTPRLPLHSDFGNKGHLNGPSSLPSVIFKVSPTSRSLLKASSIVSVKAIGKSRNQKIWRK